MIEVWSRIDKVYVCNSFRGYDLMDQVSERQNFWINFVLQASILQAINSLENALDPRHRDVVISNTTVYSLEVKQGLVSMAAGAK